MMHTHESRHIDESEQGSAIIMVLLATVLLGMGLVFQMPAVVYFLARMGLVTARFLASNIK